MSMSKHHGLDVAKATFDAAPAPQGPAQSFPRTIQGVDAYLAWAEQCGQVPEHITMEATGAYSTELAGWLLSKRPGLQVAIINPALSKAFGKSLGIRNKTDKIDARLLARYGAERRPAPWQPMPDHYQQLRELVRQRHRLVDLLTGERNRLNESPCAHAARALQNAFISNMEKALKATEAKIHRLFKTKPELKQAFTLLSSIPGVGMVSIATVLGELGDITRFSRSRQLAAFAGLSPRQRSSGQVRGRTTLCKMGSPRVRQVLYMAAMAAATHGNNSLRCTYKHLIENGKAPKAAVCAIMRRILLLMRALLKTNTSYNDQFALTGGGKLPI